MIFAVLTAFLAALVTASATLSGLAALDVSRTLSGEVWRLISGHLAHLTWWHYLLDAPAFVLLYSTYGRREGSIPAVLLALSAAASVSATVIAAGRHQVYGGLSGLSCAAASAVVLSLVFERPRSWAPYLGFLAYVLYLSSPEGMASGVAVAREAHLAGAASGAAFALTRHYLL